MLIRRGDNVIVISGEHKGKTGKVNAVFPREQRVIIEGVNLRKKHQKARRANQKGQVIEVAMPIHVSNAALIDSSSGKATRIVKKLVGGKRVRTAERSGKEI